MLCRSRFWFLSIVFLIAILNGGLNSSAQSDAADPDRDAFILLSSRGGLQLWWPEREWLINVDLIREFDLSAPVQFQRVAAGPEGIFILSQQGGVYSLLERRALLEPQSMGGEGRDLLLSRDGRSLWMLDSQGRLFPCPVSPAVPGSPLVSMGPGEPAVVAEDRKGELWIVSREGLLTCIQKAQAFFPERPFDSDLVDFEFNPYRTGGLALDSRGGLFAWGDALGEKRPMHPEFGRPLAEDLEFSSVAKDDYYILDRQGNIFSASAETVLSIPEPLSSGYAAMAVLPGDLLFRLWREHYPPLSVGIEPPQLRVPYWYSSVRLGLDCEQARDLTEFSCSIEFDPTVLAPRQIYQGELFQAGRGRGIIMDDSRSAEGLLAIRGGSADRRSGSGVNGSGQLFEIEMDIVQPGSSSLKVFEFSAQSFSMPGSPLKISGISSGFISIYYARPAIFPSLSPLSGSGRSELEVIPQESGIFDLDESFSVYLLVNHVKGMKGMRYDLSFNPNVLKLLAVEERSFLKRQGPVLLLAEPADGVVSSGRLEDQGLVVLGRGSGASGPGEVVRYLFKGRRTGSCRIGLSNAVLVDENRQRIPLQTDSAYVEVEIGESK